MNPAITFEETSLESFLFRRSHIEKRSTRTPWPDKPARPLPGYVHTGKLINLSVSQFPLV